MEVVITGDLNQANLFQDYGSAGSSMRLAQGGDANIAEMQQIGLMNTMNLTQTTTGAINTATLTQNGMRDTMTVSQTNGATATLTQN
jgi:hypothetical protein